MRYLRFLKRMITNAHYRHWWLLSLGMLVTQSLRRVQDLSDRWASRLRWKCHYIATVFRLPQQTRIHTGLEPHYRILTCAPTDPGQLASVRACGINTLTLHWPGSPEQSPDLSHLPPLQIQPPQSADPLFFILCIQLNVLAKMFDEQASPGSPSATAAPIQALAKWLQDPLYACLQGRPIILCQSLGNDGNLSTTVTSLRRFVQDTCGHPPWLVKANTGPSAADPHFDADLLPTDWTASPEEQALNAILELAAKPRSHACLLLNKIWTANTGPAQATPALGVEIRNFMASALLTQSSHTGSDCQCIFLDLTGQHLQATATPALHKNLPLLQKAMLAALCLAPPEQRRIPSGAAPEPKVAQEPEQSRPAMAVLLHIYYADLLDEIAAHLSQLTVPFDLLVSIGPNAEAELRQDILRKWPQAEVQTFENRGRDIRPFIQQLPLLISRGYQCVLKLHTKKSPHREDGAAWRQAVYGSLTGGPDMAQAMYRIFSRYPTLGMVGPSQCVINHNRNQGLNRSWLNTLFEENYIAKTWADLTYPYFAAGSMFWFRPLALRSLLESPSVALDRFEPEAGQVDSTLAHALERFMACLLYYRGYQILDMPTACSLANEAPAALTQAHHQWIARWKTSARLQRASIPFDTFNTSPPRQID